MTTELAIRPDQTAFDEKQLAALRSLGVQNAPAADIAIFFHQAARTGLDPFSRQIYLINRGGKNTIQVGIDGFRLIRDRAGTFRGQTEEWCGPDGKWTDVWLKKEPPAAARVQVYVDGYARPVPGIALWTEYAQLGRDGKPQSVWASKPALMLAKCAEALALRKAYPQDLSGLYTSDEIPEAEQDADGVYVTTTMRNGTEPRHNGPRGRASETRVTAGPESQRTPVAASRPDRPRPATSAAGAVPDPADARDQAAVYADWHDRITATDTIDALVRLHTEAADRHILDHARDGRSIEDAFLHRRAEIIAAEPRPEPSPPFTDDEDVPF